MLSENQVNLLGTISERCPFGDVLVHGLATLWGLLQLPCDYDLKKDLQVLIEKGLIGEVSEQSYVSTDNLLEYCRELNGIYRGVGEEKVLGISVGNFSESHITAHRRYTTSKTFII